jgi:hypothetical protein
MVPVRSTVVTVRTSLRGFIPAGLTIFAHHTRTHRTLLSVAYSESLMHVSGPVCVVRHLYLVTQSNHSFAAVSNLCLAS